MLLPWLAPLPAAQQSSVQIYLLNSLNALYLHRQREAKHYSYLVRYMTYLNYLLISLGFLLSCLGTGVLSLLTGAASLCFSQAVVGVGKQMQIQMVHIQESFNSL